MRSVLGALVVAVLLAGCGLNSGPTPPPCPTAAPTADEATAILADATTAEFSTSQGAFTVTLDPSSAPIATANFVALARCGFYDGQSFHRVLTGFVIQAGDPQTRDNHGDFEGLGSGGPGYKFKIEFPAADQPYDKYTVAMANALQYDRVTLEIQGGTDTNGSQFFIDLARLAGQLPPYYSVFGQVTDGTDTIDAIGAVPVNDPEQGVPIDPVIIDSVTIPAGS
jgi:cyclophilin family peptidyl-prolyl cis-trans isomerase